MGVAQTNLATDLVSVIMPVYNGAAYLGEALASVLQQTYPTLEVIIVDDGSTDHSACLVAALSERSPVPLRYVFQENQGPAAARNRGIGLAQGEMTAFLDQDDLWLPQKIERQVGRLRDNPDWGYVLTMAEFFLDPGFARPEWLRPEQLAGPQMGFLPSCLLTRRWVFEQIDLFDPTLTTSSDADWFFRAQDAHIPMAVLPEVLARHRFHAGNQSRHISTTQIELVAIARRSVRRKQQEETTE